MCQEFLHMKQWANSKMFEQGFTEWKITWAANEFSSSFAFSLGPCNWVLANRMQTEVMNDTFNCWGWGQEIEMEKEDEEEEKQREKKKEKQQHLSPPAGPSSSLPPTLTKAKVKCSWWQGYRMKDVLLLPYYSLCQKWRVHGLSLQLSLTLTWLIWHSLQRISVV